MNGQGSHNFINNLNAGAVSFDGGSATGEFHQPTAASPAGAPRGKSGSKALLIVAAEVERNAVLAAVRTVNRVPFQRTFNAHHTIYELGRLSRVDVVLAHVAQGVVTPDSAGPAAASLLEAVRPDFVLLVGICYGLKDDDTKRPQRLGDVLVASELRLIAHKKVADDQIHRGGSVHPSAMLLDRFRTATVDWPIQAAVHIGPMVSESVLVDSPEYRAAVKLAHPEAIGGEMEGAAVYAAAVRSQTQWGLVKAICDWGLGKTDDYQKLAADNAASLVTHMIGIGGLDPVEPSHGDSAWTRQNRTHG